MTDNITTSKSFDVYAIIDKAIVDANKIAVEQIGVELDSYAQTFIYNELIQKDIHEEIQVVGIDEEICGARRTNFGDYYIEVTFHNDVLSVKIAKSEAAKAREVADERKAKFREFWTENDLPETMFAEALTKIDLTKTITITSCKFVKGWSRMRKAESGELLYIGQKFNDRYGFVADKPIGYVIDNRIVISDPGKQDKKIEFSC